MFGRDKQRSDVDVLPPPTARSSAPAPAEAAASAETESVLAPSMAIKGDVNFEGAMRIEGVVHGKITGQGRLTISPSGKVIGDIFSAEVIVQGTVQGNVSSVDRLEIASNAQVVGDLKAGRLVVAEGAKILGRLDVNSESIMPLPVEENGNGNGHAVPSRDALDKVL